MNRYQFEAKLQSNHLAPANVQGGDQKQLSSQSSTPLKQPELKLSKPATPAKAD
jgi:hypothetical protein